MYRHLIASLLFVYVFTFPLAYLGVLGDAVVPATVVIAGGNGGSIWRACVTLCVCVCVCV